MTAADWKRIARDLAKAVEAKSELLVCYRFGKQPTEALFARLEKANAALAAYETAVESDQ